VRITTAKEKGTEQTIAKITLIVNKIIKNFWWLKTGKEVFVIYDMLRN